MSAVGLYAIPSVAKRPIAKHLHKEYRPYAKPYVLSMSQWQRWNLFSPDPLRRVETFTIEVKEGEAWFPKKVFNFDSLPWWNRSSELKILRRLANKKKKSARPGFLHSFCREEGLERGTKIRLRKSWYVIPKHEELHSPAWWNTWEPETKTRIDSSTTCP